ncbi:MAG: HIT domain-containing protein [Candidatus Paceibacterota bacterium]
MPVADSTVDTTYAKNDPEYLRLLEETEGCPFCPPRFPGQNKILYSADGSEGQWHVMERLKTLVPYPNVDTHLLILPERHVSSFEGLDGFQSLGLYDFRAIQDLIEWAKEEFPIFKIGGGLAVRLGTNSGVTIYHVHFHLIAPKTDPKTGKVFADKHVNFPIG